MTPRPGRDSVEFVLGISLGAAAGWLAVTLLRSDPDALESPSPAGSGPALVDAVKRRARGLAAESGEELARLAVGSIRRALIGPGRTEP